jgi:hypothetical protein
LTKYSRKTILVSIILTSICFLSLRDYRANTKELKDFYKGINLFQIRQVHHVIFDLQNLKLKIPNCNTKIYWIPEPHDNVYWATPAVGQYAFTPCPFHIINSTEEIKDTHYYLIQPKKVSPIPQKNFYDLFHF